MLQALTCSCRVGVERQRLLAFSLAPSPGAASVRWSACTRALVLLVGMKPLTWLSQVSFSKREVSVDTGRAPERGASQPAAIPACLFALYR